MQNCGKMVMSPGIEPGACSLGESRPIQLSYDTLYSGILVNMPRFFKNANVNLKKNT